MLKGTSMTEEQKRKISETRKKLFKEKRIVTWNKGLTKEDERVLKNISGGSRKTQFKSGPRKDKVGILNPNWKGGEIIHQGYKYLRVPKHKHSKNGYVQEHRLIIENYIGRILNPEEIVHHKNKNTLDNRIDNLEIMSQREHIKLHINRGKNKCK